MDEFLSAEEARRQGKLCDQPSLRQILNQSVRYWEPRRLVYNGVLTAVVGLAVCWHGPALLGRVNLLELAMLLTLAVLANLCYCAAYIPDVLLQYAGLGKPWLAWRPALFYFGLLLAALLTACLTMPEALLNF